MKSSFGDQEIQFPPYDANQLLDIMEARRDAFYDDVLEPRVIPKSAALAAREHGDARKAIQILKNAGLIAEDRSEATVRVEHLDAAKNRAEVGRLEEHLSSQTPHAATFCWRWPHSPKANRLTRFRRLPNDADSRRLHGGL